MIERMTPVSEDELHAFIDGQLPVDRREAVAAWLSENPDKAAMVAAWRAQAEGIRALYGAVADEPVPERLKVDNVLRRTGAASRKWVALGAIAATVAFIIGGTAGWFARGASAAAPTGFESLTADAIDAHKLYVVEVRHPVEVPGSERAHMTQWLTKRLGYEQRIPDLQAMGLKLVGGRLLPGPTGAAAFYMYEGPSGERFTIYCAKSGVSETALRFKQGSQVSAFYWVDDKVAYVVSGPGDREKLETISKAIYDQVDKAAVKKS
jgi:anti-sigma factor RsiW